MQRKCKFNYYHTWLHFKKKHFPPHHALVMLGAMKWKFLWFRVFVFSTFLCLSLWLSTKFLDTKSRRHVSTDSKTLNSIWTRSNDSALASFKGECVFNIPSVAISTWNSTIVAKLWFERRHSALVALVTSWFAFTARWSNNIPLALFRRTQI